MGETLTQVRTKLLEKKSRLRELAAEDKLDDDGEAEFSKLPDEITKLERRELALATDGGEPEVVATGNAADDKDVAAFEKLVSEASIGTVLDVACFGRKSSGPTRELQQEIGIDENVIPFELFANSTVTSGGDAEIQEDTLDVVFPSPLSMAMGVDRRTTGVGVVNVPVVTAPTSAVQSVTAIGTGVSDETVTITGVQLTPGRLQIAATMGRDELSTFRGLEDDVERTLRESLTSGLDYQALYAGTDDGLLNHGSAPAAGSTTETFASIWEDIASAIDGRYASRLADLSVLAGVKSYTLATNLYRANETDETVIEKIDRLTAGIMTSAHVAAPSSDVQQGVVARGGAMHIGQVQRMWGGVEVIRDPYTLAHEGQIRVSLVLMQATGIVRAGVYKRFALYTA